MNLFSARHLAVAAILLVSAGIAVAQTYPSKPVTVVVPHAMGGTTDIVVRLVNVASEMQRWGTVVKAAGIKAD